MLHIYIFISLFVATALLLLQIIVQKKVIYSYFNLAILWGLLVISVVPLLCFTLCDGILTLIKNLLEDSYWDLLDTTMERSFK